VPHLPRGCPPRPARAGSTARFEQKLALTNEDALSSIPQHHVVCTSTLVARDRELMEKACGDGRLWEIDTGHDLMITEPRAVAHALLDVAAS
jgi:hypothetical protein